MPGRRHVKRVLEVATLVTQATDGTDPDLVVAKLVEEVTDDKSLEKQERKRLQIVNASKRSARAKILKRQFCL